MHRFLHQVQRRRLLLWTFLYQRELGRPLEDHGLQKWDLWIELQGDLVLWVYVRCTILNRLQSLLFDRVWQPNRGNVLLQSPEVRDHSRGRTYGSGNDDERVNLKVSK